MPGDPESGLAVLVLENEDSHIVAAPLFMDDDDALPSDRKLFPEPDFLVGESWVALAAKQRISASGFKQRLGEIPRWQASQLRSAECDLPRGLPLLPWLGDRRVETRDALCGALRAHAASPALEMMTNLGRLVYDKAEKVWVQVDKQVSGLAVQARFVTVRVRGEEKKELELSFPVPGGDIALRLEPCKNEWIVKLCLDDFISRIELLDGVGTAHSGESFGSWWIFGEDNPVSSGECRISWWRKGGEAASVVVILPSPMEMP